MNSPSSPLPPKEGLDHKGSVLRRLCVSQRPFNNTRGIRRRSRQQTRLHPTWQQLQPSPTPLLISPYSAAGGENDARPFLVRRTPSPESSDSEDSMSNSKRRASVPTTCKMRLFTSMPTLPPLSGTSNDEDMLDMVGPEHLAYLLTPTPVPKTENWTPVQMPLCSSELPLSRLKSHELPQPLSSASASVSVSVAPISLKEYFWALLLGAPEPPLIPETKLERVEAFLAVPFQVEKTMALGYCFCVDAFLNILVFLPVRCFFGLLVLLRDRGRPCSRFAADFCRAVLVIAASLILLQLDPSILYHDIRGQSMIKLYVVFNLLDVGDKLCSSFGIDILDSLYSRSTVNAQSGRPSLPFLLHFAMATLYLVLHSAVYYYQMVTLNVAINTSSSALLTLLISNQFVEIKSSVFKRFEVENFFQLTCADIVERMNLSIFLLLNVARNYIELLGSAHEYAYAVNLVLPVPVLAPNGGLFGTWIDISWYTIAQCALSPALVLLAHVIQPALMVGASELVVDWVKHAFVGKFNNISPTVQWTYRRVLVSELGSTVEPKPPGPNSTLDQGIKRPHAIDLGTERVARRLGFSALPLCVLVCRMAHELADASVQQMSQNSGVLHYFWSICPPNVVALSVMFAILFTFRVVLGYVLLRVCATMRQSGNGSPESARAFEILSRIDRYSLVKSRIP